MKQGLERRSLIGGAIGAAALVSAGVARSAPETIRSYKRIACEEGFATPELVAEMTRFSGGVQTMATGMIRGPGLAIAYDLDDGRLAGMDAAGIDIQMLMPGPPGVQMYEPNRAITLARLTNDHLAAAVARHPHRLAGFALMAPQAAEASARELERALKAGLSGGVLFSHTDNLYLSDRRFWPLLEAAEALGAPLYVHPRDPAAGLASGLNIPGYSVGWSYGVETGTHAINIMASGVLERFPGLTIVLGHLGEMIPFALDRLDSRYAWENQMFSLTALPLKPSEYFKRNFRVTTSGMNFPRAITAALEVLGSSNILFAADYPMEDQAEAVRSVEGMGLSLQARQALFQDNAAATFRLAI